MDWFTSTDSDLALLEDSTLDNYVDGLPDSYDLTQWYGSQDYPLSTLDDSEMADLVDGRAPLFTPWHGTVIVSTLLSDDGVPVASDGWHAENIKIHIY